MPDQNQKKMFYRVTTRSALIKYEVNAEGRLVREDGLPDDEHGVEVRKTSFISDGVRVDSYVLESGLRTVYTNHWEDTGAWMTDESCAKMLVTAFEYGVWEAHLTAHTTGSIVRKRL
ncbi:MAG: hypothetical protein WAZ14_00580 [Patescibacteria group bacterium]